MPPSRSAQPRWQPSSPLGLKSSRPRRSSPWRKRWPLVGMLPASRCSTRYARTTPRPPPPDPTMLGIPRARDLHQLSQPPFYAIRFLPGITCTYGGVRINSHTQVLDSTGRPLGGLFAAGADAGGVYTRGYTGGLSMGSGLRPHRRPAKRPQAHIAGSAGAWRLAARFNRVGAEAPLLQSSLDQADRMAPTHSRWSGGRIRIAGRHNPKAHRSPGTTALVHRRAGKQSCERLARDSAASTSLAASRFAPGLSGDNQTCCGRMDTLRGDNAVVVGSDVAMLIAPRSRDPRRLAAFHLQICTRLRRPVATLPVNWPCHASARHIGSVFTLGPRRCSSRVARLETKLRVQRACRCEVNRCPDSAGAVIYPVNT